MLTGRDVAGLQALAPDVRCVNLYGATETPQAMGWHAVTPEETAAGDQVLPVGRGIDGVQLLVLDRRDLLAGVGELGEIAVRTPYLARGLPGRTRRSPPSASPRTPSRASPATASTAPATSAATARTARSSSRAAPTTR